MNSLKLAVFADWKIPRANKYYPFARYRDDIRVAREAGASDIVLGLSPAHLRAPRRTDVIRAVQIAWEEQLEPWLMVWAHRNATLRPRLRALRELAVESQSQKPILDLERPWRIGPLDLGKAVGIVEQELDGLLWAVTCLSTCSRQTAALARVAPLSIPQPYSCWEPDSSVERRRLQADDPTKIRPIRGGAPPNLQLESWQSWSPHAQEMELGIALYWLERPGMSAEEVLRWQIKAAQGIGCERVWGWSLRALVAQRRWMVPVLGEMVG